MICRQLFFNSERRADEPFLFGDSERKEEEETTGRRGGVAVDEKGGGDHLMRLLGCNQYGIWPEDDWKTNLIWEAICLSFISYAVSTEDRSRYPKYTFILYF